MPGHKICVKIYVYAQTWLWPHDYNMSGNKCVWAQMCVGRTYLGTNMSGHKRVGSRMYGHKRVVSSISLFIVIIMLYEPLQNFVC